METMMRNIGFISHRAKEMLPFRVNTSHIFSEFNVMCLKKSSSIFGEPWHSFCRAGGTAGGHQQTLWSPFFLRTTVQATHVCARLPNPPPPCLGANQQHNSVSEKHQSGVVSQISWHPWLTTPDWCSVCVGLCVIVWVCVCVWKKIRYIGLSSCFFKNVTSSLLQLTLCVVST